MVFGVSEAVHSFENFNQAFDQAKQALELKFYHSNDPVFYYRPHDKDIEQKMEQINDYVMAMKKGLKEESYDLFAKNLEAWEQYIQLHECLTERDVRKIYEGLLFMLQDGKTDAGIAGQSDEIEDFFELSAYYHELFNERLRAKISGTNKEYNPLVRGIMQYIENNYQESISLKLLGETFQTSPNYISRLFKQEVDRGLFDYLNEVRIRKSKDLLKDYRYKIYEVAEMVGFKSQVHFAIVFHKYVGMAPKDYRKEIG
jgi:two-component system response regulator YesN